MSHEFAASTRYDDGSASEELTGRIDEFTKAHDLGETEVVLQEAKERIDHARHTLDAVEGLSGNPIEELVDMVSQARATGGEDSVGDADRVIELAVIDGQDNDGVLVHELNRQLESEGLAVVDAMRDLSMASPHEMSRLTTALDAEVYFHGSNYPFEIGDKIAPGAGAILGKDGQLHASATTSERTAWAYALSKETGSYGYRNRETGVNLRSRVYEVVPSDGKPAERLGPQFGEVNSPSFTVVGYRDVQPGHQATIPEVNWSEHTPYVGANHPEDPLYIPENDYREPVQRSPDEVPLPGLDDEYVRAEQERIRKASGYPDM